MARKSKEAILAEERARQDEINRQVEERMTDMMPGLMAKATAEAFAKLSEQLTTARAGLGGDVAAVNRSADHSLLEGLAHAMAKAADPANKRRILPPEVVKERNEAREKVAALLLQNHAKGEVPVYKVVSKTFMGEMLIDPQYLDQQTKRMRDQEVNWPGWPSTALLPISESAHEVMALYLQSIGRKAVDQTKLPAPWVMSGGKILRGRAGADPEAPISSPMGMDPRRHGDRGGQKQETINILGKTAAPAVVGP